MKEKKSEGEQGGKQRHTSHSGQAITHTAQNIITTIVQSEAAPPLEFFHI